jgi:hypothetical protein
MSKHPVKHEAVDVVAIKPGVGTFTSFRYSSVEISVRGGKAHVNARRARWDDGKLSSEAFEGDVDRTVYEQAVLQAQRYFIDQTAMFLQSMASFLPFAGKRSRDGD